uniref:ShKT domain-containing protein n=1 Tax=Gongylonema pulchrum TaxID=637853 RepID=A0A183D957_9BILA
LRRGWLRCRRKFCSTTSTGAIRCARWYLSCATSCTSRNQLQQWWWRTLLWLVFLYANVVCGLCREDTP